MLVGRITIEVLRPVPLAPLAVDAAVVRPGRNVELVEAALIERGRRRARSRARTAWRLRLDPGVRRSSPTSRRRPGRTPAASARSSRPARPSATTPRWTTASSRARSPSPARRRVWMRMRHPLVAGEPTSPLARVLVAADSGNGVSAALDYRRHLFINTELTVHLIREPAGEWVRLDAVTRVGPARRRPRRRPCSRRDRAPRPLRADAAGAGAVTGARGALRSRTDGGTR